MKPLRSEEVRAVILACVEPALRALGSAGEVPDTFDLRSEGIVDSLGFVQLVMEVEGRLGFPIDLAGLDPEQLTMVGPLSRSIARQSHARSKELTT